MRQIILNKFMEKEKSVIFHRQWFWIQIQQLTDVLSILTEFKDIVLIQKLIVFLYASNYQEIDENIPFEKSFQASKIHYIQGEFYFKPSFFFFFSSKNGIWNIAEFFWRLDIYNLGILNCLGLNWSICLSYLFKTFGFPIHICALCFWHLIVNLGK